MISLILSIISTSSIFVIFKYIEKFKVSTFNAIIVNYFVAASLGFIFNNSGIGFSAIINSNWIPYAIFIGICFIIMFNVIGLSSQKAGITVTTIASKMSVIIPILFSIIYYAEEIGILKVIGILVALVSVSLSIIPSKKQTLKKKHIYLPILLFFGAGFIDSIIKFTQDKYITEELSSIFSATLFSIAGAIGVLVALTNKKLLNQFKNPKVYLLGFILGIGNFGSIYFLINALNNKSLESSIIFGINNIGIVGLSILTGLLIFKEKLSFINWIGIILTVVAITILSYS